MKESENINEENVVKTVENEKDSTKSYFNFSESQWLILLYHMNKKEVKLGRSLFIQCKVDDVHKYYDFVKELGRGGFGKVYEVILKRNPAIRRAVKSVRKSKVICHDTLRNQIEILGIMDHPNIIKIFQTFEDDQFFHIVMDICTGDEFFYYLIQKGSISERQARHFFRQMVEAVQYCHNHKIAHRDLKPQNFLLLSDTVKNLKLIDFGLAFKWEENMKEQMKQQKMIGTPYYVCPEAIRHKTYDHRCDIWSLGVILYIMVTASPPFNGSNDRQILKAVRRGAYNLSGTQLTALSPDLRNLIAKILTSVQKRITIPEILNHPWLRKQPSSASHKLNFGKMYSYVRSNKMKKLAVNCIASQLSEQDIQKLGQIFKQVDKDGDGVISSEQFKNTLLTQKSLTSQKQIEHLLNAIDIDKDGIINYSQFVTSCLQNSIIFKKQNILNAFQLLDKDEDGKVSGDQLRQLLKSNFMLIGEMNTDVSGISIQEIIHACDKNGDGYLDINQFTSILASW